MTEEEFAAFRDGHVALLITAALAFEKPGFEVTTNGHPFLGDADQVACLFARWIRKVASIVDASRDYTHFAVYVDHNAIGIAERMYPHLHVHGPGCAHDLDIWSDGGYYCRACGDKYAATLHCRYGCINPDARTEVDS
jgi:hypothetical protein